MEKEEKMIQCSKCGATIKESQAYCNYCGSINILGAEIDYLNKLENVRSDLAEMGDDSDEEFKKTVKLSTKYIIIILAVAVVLILGYFGIRYAVNKAEDSHYSASYNEMQEIFAGLNAMYEAGDLEGLRKFYQEENHSDNYRVYDWEHYYFISVYSYRAWFESSLEKYRNPYDEEDRINARKWAIHDAVNLHFDAEREFSVRQMTEDEVTQVEAWAAETERILLDEGIITEKQWNDLCAVYVSEDGTYMMVDDYMKYFDENLK